MAQYSLAPGYIKLRYSVTINSIAMNHVMTIPIVPESPTWANLNVLQGNGVGVLWTTGITAFVNVAKKLYNASCTFVDAILYRQDTPTSAPVVMATTALGITGDDAAANGQARGDLYFFTTTGGHPVKILLLENIFTPNLVQQYAALDVDQKAFVDYIKGTTSIVRGRDGLPAIAFQREITKNYDKVRKIRLAL